jgi:hypothetical protein
VPVPISRRLILGASCLAALLSGCERPVGDPLIVATSWPATERRRLESEFAGWLADHPDSSSPIPIRLDWLILSPGDDLAPLADRREPPDVVLGGSVPQLERLARTNRLAPPSTAGSSAWAVVRRAVIRVVATRGVPAPADDRGVAFDDPRGDPLSLAWAEAQLAGPSFREGYARLVRAAGDRRRIGRRPGSAAAAVERGAADRAPAVDDATDAARDAEAIPWLEGVAILADGRHPDRARRFLRFLAETGRAAPPPTSPHPFSPDARELLAELLGATLVDAQDELWSAGAAVDRPGSPGGAARWMTEPPPWPPASIAKILTREGESAMAMVETLAGQVATDPTARSWLIQSWLSPPRPLDRELLEELARAADGRLVRERRFREWLRAEWTAWARQRYRRVSRAAGRLSHEGTPTGAPAWGWAVPPSAGTSPPSWSQHPSRPASSLARPTRRVPRSVTAGRGEPRALRSEGDIDFRRLVADNPAGVKGWTARICRQQHVIPTGRFSAIMDTCCFASRVSRGSDCATWRSGSGSRSGRCSGSSPTWKRPAT